MRAADGSFWIGEEFGPFLLHVDATGKVLPPPVEFPDGKSPANPYLQPGETPRVRSSRGFEAMATSPDGRCLYPIVEGSFTDDPRRRAVASSTSSTPAPAATPAARGQYETDTDDNVIGDAFTVGNGRLLRHRARRLRGPGVGDQAALRGRPGRTDRDGFVRKELVRRPAAHRQPGRHRHGRRPAPTASATRSPSRCSPSRSPSSCADGTLLVGNDNNYPGSNGRVPGTPDDTELIIIDVGDQRGRGPTSTRSSSATGAPAATAPSTRWPPTSRRSCSAPTSSSPTSCRPRTACSWPGTRTRSAAPPTSPPSPEFADRRTTKTIDGVADHRLVHRGLHARRAAHAAGQGADPGDPARQHRVRRAATASRRSTRSSTWPATPAPATVSPVGVYPETKHPTYFDSIGLSLEEPLVRVARTPTATAAATPRCSSRASRPATCATSTRLTELPLAAARQLHAARRTTSSPPATPARTPTW